MNDELRNELARLDPMRDVPVEPSTSPSARARIERIMNTPIHSSDPVVTTAQPSNGRPQRRRWTAIGVAAAAVAVLGVGTVIVAQDDDGGGEVAGPPLELSLGSESMQMCMVFDEALLADMSPAFAGTVDSVDGETITLSVDKWYAGGDAETVVLHSTAGMEALIGGVDFEVGKAYLITAAEGNVNFCGYSGLATPELTGYFEAAFA